MTKCGANILTIITRVAIILGSRWEAMTGIACCIQNGKLGPGGRYVYLSSSLPFGIKLISQFQLTQYWTLTKSDELLNPLPCWQDAGLWSPEDLELGFELHTKRDHFRIENCGERSKKHWSYWTSNKVLCIVKACLLWKDSMMIYM